MRSRNAAFGIGGAVVGALAMIVFAAGPLDPPAGPVESTHKTLTQVEPRIPIGQADVPFEIISTGSYYLTEDLLTTGNIDAIITINAENVSIDLNGYTINCFSELGAATAGITAPFGEGHTIRNGAIMTAIDYGINASLAAQVLVENIRVAGIISGAGAGIRTGSDSVVRNCRSTDNGALGFWIGQAGVVDGCTASGNDVRGFDLAFGCVLRDSTMRGNGEGVNAQPGCLIENCVARNNSGHGIFCEDGTTVRGCSSSINDDRGIHVGDGSLVANCSAFDNDTGIFASNSLVIGCTALFNDTTEISAPLGTEIDNHTGP